MSAISVSVSLSTQLLTVAVLTLQRQLAHNRVASSFNLETDGSSSSPEVVDYIVVGGGTAGCIVASRLAENTSLYVILLEAGGPMTVTREMTPLINLAEDAWPYTSVRQENAGKSLLRL